MIGAEDIEAIVSQYERFGWKLDRLLLTRDLAARLSGHANAIFSDTPVESSDLDAAWFTRASKGGGTAWELRALEAFPFAYVEVIPDDMSAEEQDEILQATEDKLRERRAQTAKGLSGSSETDS
jgi:hypothetical protein